MKSIFDIKMTVNSGGMEFFFKSYVPLQRYLLYSNYVIQTSLSVGNFKHWAAVTLKGHVGFEKKIIIHSIQKIQQFLLSV